MNFYQFKNYIIQRINADSSIKIKSENIGPPKNIHPYRWKAMIASSKKISYNDFNKSPFLG